MQIHKVEMRSVHRQGTGRAARSLEDKGASFVEFGLFSRSNKSPSFRIKAPGGFVESFVHFPPHM